MMSLITEENAQIDEVERAMLNSENLIEFPVKHSFTPGMYIREIFMPTGSLLTSKVHNTEHPFVVLTGVALVKMPDNKTEVLAAGHCGITKADTRRALYIEQDCRWVTFHPLSEVEERSRKEGLNDEDLVSLIEGRIITKRLIADNSEKTMFDLYKEKLETTRLVDKGDELCLG